MTRRRNTLTFNLVKRYTPRRMKRNNFFKSKFSLLSLITLSLVAVGCDQTLDEYHQERVDQNLTRLQSVAGKYTGTIVNQQTQASMGTIEIDLGTTLIPVNNSDQTQMTTEAALTGTVIINGGDYPQGSAGISNLAFGGLDSSKSGALTGDIAMTLSSGAQVSLAISGTITNGTLSGTISSNSQAASVVGTGQFTTSLNGAQAGTQGLNSGSTQVYDLQHDYTGTLSMPAAVGGKTGKGQAGPSAQGVMMTTRLISVSSGEWLYDRFAQQLNMVVTLVFVSTDPVTGQTVTDNEVTFTNVSVDGLGGSFDATGNFSGDVNATVSLSCNQAGAYQANSAWSCSFMSSHNGINQNFTAVAQN